MKMQSKMTFAMPFLQKLNAFARRYPARMAVIISILLYAITVIVVPTALNVSAITTIGMLTLLLSFAAAGQTIVLIGGGLDLSVGAVMSSAALLTAGIMNGQDGNFIPAFIAVIAMGAAVGFINGFCTTKIGLPALIVTLVISNVVTRLQYVTTEGRPFGFPSPTFIQTVIGRFFGYIPSIVLYAIIIFPLVFYVLNRSRFGKQLYLVGNNSEAARLSGINVNKIKVLSYVFSGMFAAFAGMLGAGFRQIVECQMFDEYAFNSLVAVIIGGTTFAGGVGTYTGSIAGALLMVVLSNLLTTLGFSPPIRHIVFGAVLVLLLTMYNRKKPLRQ
jgi:ribose transport system permease protein